MVADEKISRNAMGWRSYSTTTATQGKLNRMDDSKTVFQLTGNTAPKVVFLSLNS